MDVYGYGCPENSLEILHQSLMYALPDSHFYMFTDATADTTTNDYLLENTVIEVMKDRRATVSEKHLNLFLFCFMFLYIRRTQSDLVYFEITTCIQLNNLLFRNLILKCFWH